MTAGKGSVKSAPAESASQKSQKLKQADFPQLTLQDSQKIASCLVDNYAGTEAPPPDVAIAMGISPTSSGWRVLTSSSMAYGLTEGSFSAAKLKLADLGRRLVAPEEEGDDLVARREAILRPRISKEFFERYQRAKFPADTVATNVLRSLGVTQERLTSALEVLKANGKYAGVIRDTPTGMFVSLDSPIIPAPAATLADPATSATGSAVQIPEVQGIKATLIASESNKRVFISHGKQRAIAAQIKELLTFGSFEPVLSVERESTAIPVPEKVFEDMRSCIAGVIHVSKEAELLDKDGNTHSKINDNVLIEIGAAIALYGKRVILLVEKGVPLPSNLQGLYRCDFDGDKLDYESTMKLLKTFSQFR